MHPCRRGSVQLANLTGGGDRGDDRNGIAIRGADLPCFDVVEIQPELICAKVSMSLSVVSQRVIISVGLREW